MDFALGEDRVIAAVRIGLQIPFEGTEECFGSVACSTRRVIEHGERMRPVAEVNPIPARTCFSRFRIEYRNGRNIGLNDA
jgi:hypothetical protein